MRTRPDGGSGAAAVPGLNCRVSGRGRRVSDIPCCVLWCWGGQGIARCGCEVSMSMLVRRCADGLWVNRLAGCVGGVGGCGVSLGCVSVLQRWLGLL